VAEIDRLPAAIERVLLALLLTQLQAICGLSGV